jgi:hypothetical protein
MVVPDSAAIMPAAAAPAPPAPPPPTPAAVEPVALFGVVLDALGDELPQAASATVATIAPPPSSTRRQPNLAVGRTESGHGRADWMVMFVLCVSRVE